MNQKLFGISLSLVITVFFVLLTILISIESTDVKQPDVKQPDVKQPDVKQPDVKQPDDQLEFTSGEVILKFKKQFISSLFLGSGIREIPINMDELSVIREKYSITSIKSIIPKPTNPEKIPFFEPLSGYFIVTFDKQYDVDKVVSSFIDLSIVEKAEPNFYFYLDAIPNDPNFATELWGLNNSVQTLPELAQTCSGLGNIGTPNMGIIDADIDATEFWDMTTGDGSFVVGVLDTGIDYTHPDLIDNMWTNPLEIPNNGIDEDGNGFVDDYYGYDFADNDPDPMDYHSHGTHVAGIIGATGHNGIGVTGVNWNVKLMALKVTSQTSTSSGLIQAMHYATMMGVKVVNFSSGGYLNPNNLSNTPDYLRIANENGILFVTTAGNSGTNNDVMPYGPSGYHSPNIISVAATTNSDELWSSSQYGPTTVDLGAPGVKIFSTVIPDCGGLTGSPGQSYFWKTGTSQAAPYVAGAVALVWSHFPTEDYMQIKHRILGSVDKIPALQGLVLSDGRLNLQNTLDSDSIPPSQISNLSITDIQDVSVTLSWTAPGDDGNTGTASFYDLRYSTNPITDSNFVSAIPVNIRPVNSVGSTETFTVSNLEITTDYYFAIKTYDNVGNTSQLSNVVMATTLDDTIPPSQITDLNVVNTSRTTASLEWTAPGDDGASGQARNYELRFATFPITPSNFHTAIGQSIIPSTSGSIETFVLRNLEPNTTYYFGIKAHDNAGNLSTLSNVPTTKTLSTVVLFSDDIESGIGEFTFRIVDSYDLWHITERRSTDPGHSATHSWYYGQESTGNYESGGTNRGSIALTIDLSGQTGAELKFNNFLETDFDSTTQSPYDFAQVYVRSTSFTDRPYFEYTTGGTFVEESIDLSHFDDQVIEIEFFFKADAENDDLFEGWYVDDVQILVSGPLIDQEQPIINTEAGVNHGIGGNSEQKLAQVVTVGQTGMLTEVRLPVACSTIGSPSDLVLEIQEVTNGLPNGIILASDTFSGLSWPDPISFNNLALSTPVFFDEGDSFAIVLTSSGSCGLIPGPDGDPYSGGDAYFDSRPNTPDVWVKLFSNHPTGVDLPFQTLME